MNKLKNGFTLIELMIVIAIIGILISAVAPLFMQTNDLHESMVIENSCEGKHVYANGTCD